MHPLLAILVSGIALQDTIRPTLSADLLQRVDSIAAAEFAKDSLGSITIGVVSGPSLVWAKSYGYTDRERTVKANSETVYRIASVTKQFTALMLLQLVERGRLRLSDPVERFFPEVRRIRGKEPGSPAITFVQLATMTSGLSRDPDDARRSKSGAAANWENAVRRAMPQTTYARPPGSAVLYSNIGYATLGAGLARAAGERYVAYVTRNLLQPLGMTSTTFELTPSMTGRFPERPSKVSARRRCRS